MKTEGGSSDSIFDLSRKLGPKKKSMPSSIPQKKESGGGHDTSKERREPKMSAAEKRESVVKHDAEKESKMSAPEKMNLQSMLNRMNELNLDLQKKFDDVVAKTKLSPEQIKKLAKQISGQHREQITKQQQQLEEQIWAALGQPAKAKKERQEEKASSKARKGKTLGARRNWLSMH